MLPIKNIESLNEILLKQDPEWKKKVYNEIGVYCMKNDHMHSYVLYSTSGSADLDDEVCYYSDNKDFEEIESVNDLVDYIKSMESFKTILMDKSYGKVKKSELFNDILYNIVVPTIEQTKKKYGDDAVYIVPFNIIDDGFSVLFNYAYSGIDETYEKLKVENTSTIESIMEQFIENISKVITENNLSVELTISKKHFNVPKSFNELKQIAELLERIKCL